MAFSLKNDIRLIDNFPPIDLLGGNLAGLFLHTTVDAAATVAGAGYFNLAADRLPVGSVIMSITTNTTTPVLTNRVVTANTGTVVTIV
jgi:hypothetical protein